VAAKLIRDAVHGDIELEALEVELIDTPEFQRLRGIKQLGTAYLIYPSATHSRFEHSLGTSWMARRIIDALRRTHTIAKEEATAIRIAALLHDITHIPFGHTLEDERRVLPRHDQDEDRFRYFLRESRPARILEKSGFQQDVLNILEGKAGFAGEIVTGAITADLLDYLRRDTYFVGFSQYYDPRLFQSFTLDQGRFVVNLEKHGVLRQDTLSELINLLRIRYTLSERVYFHHTKIASGAMISKAVELALGAGLPTQELFRLKDETLICRLRDRYGGGPAITHILDRLESRQIYRACFVLTAAVGEARQKAIVDRFHSSAANRESLERDIAAALGTEPHRVIAYCPSIGMSLPEAEVLVRLENGEIRPLSGSNNEEVRVLREKHKSLWKFFVLIDRDLWDLREKARTAAEEILEN
jgi:HD superfamily phosphohydrolase